MASLSVLVRRGREAAVDIAFAAHPRLALAGLGAVFGLLWLLLTLWLFGLTGAPGERQAIIVNPETGASPTVMQWASMLRLESGQQEASLAGLDSASAPEKAWLSRAVCDTGLQNRNERAGRAWRIRNNSHLCNPVQRRLSLMPLGIQFGGPFGLMLSVLLAGGIALAGGYGLWRLYRLGVAYRRLYASEHRVDREARAAG